MRQLPHVDTQSRQHHNCTTLIAVLAFAFSLSHAQHLVTSVPCLPLPPIPQSHR
jgi:hypothetical protein